MKIEVIQLGGKVDAGERTTIIDTDKSVDSINILVSTNYEEEDEDNMLLSFDEKGDRINCYDSDGDRIVDEKPKKLEFRELIEHFGSSDYFDTDVVVNRKQVIISRTSDWIDDTVMSHILIGCVKRTFTIKKNQEGTFKLIIQI